MLSAHGCRDGADREPVDSDFFKAQAHTADRLRGLMEDRGLDTAGHDVDPAVCLDCFQTRPDQVRAALARDERMAEELAAGLR